ncbi:MAG: class II fructose-bisphosphate aldolase [Candidatus Humimicrobiia bacterium]
MNYNKPISGKLMFNALRDKDVIVIAINVRIKHCLRGVMEAAKEADSAIIFEIAKSEIGYTDQSPEEYVNYVKEIADRINFNTPYCIHGDHITIPENTPEAIKSAEEIVKKEVEAGFTSFAIDASHNFDLNAELTREQLADNIKITTRIAKLIEKLMAEKGKKREDYGLEVEVGEIGKIDPETGEQELTTVDEAVTFIKALNENGVYPDLIATNNGTVHGNIYDEEGNIIPILGIDAVRTREIASSIAPLGVKIAQHGITGTPLKLIHKLIDAGIVKGNVATNFQDIAIENMSPELAKRMADWTMKNYAEKVRAKKPKISDREIIGKNIKYAIKVFKHEIEEIDDEYKQKISDASKKSATEFIEAFNGKGSGQIVKDYIRNIKK